MASGNIESYHQLVGEAAVKKAAGKEAYDTFMAALTPFVAKHGDSNVNDALNDGDFWGDFTEDDEQFVKLKGAYDALRDSFKENTGIDVFYTYFAGDGDAYDDIEPDHWRWELLDSDVWVPKRLTAKARAFIKKYGEIDAGQRFSKYG